MLSICELGVIPGESDQELSQRVVGESYMSVSRRTYWSLFVKRVHEDGDAIVIKSRYASHESTGSLNVTPSL